ncbi:DegV family protein [Saccharospirillum impatiens]|uniref:DegV family protein n=1 Tax=Saccharospirillum impatiens TaxID=169438 RepID=UPI000422BABA|nr:DegV family protein [Saccharospirillum impatiens]
MQYLTLALDASCDLPNAVYQRFELSTLPLAWLANPTEWSPDDRSIAITDAWYQLAANTSPTLPLHDLNQDTRLSQALENHWLLNSDGALVVTPAKHRHPGYHHWNHQATILQPQLDRIRHAANLHSHFRLRVMDSGHTLAAYGLLVQEIARLHRDEGLSIDKLRRPLLAFAPRIRHIYSTPAAANSMRTLEKPVFPNVNWLQRALLNHQQSYPIFQVLDGQEERIGRATAADPITPVVEQICATLEASRLNCPAVNASFAGDTDPLQQHPAVRRLHQLVTRQGGHLWLSRMSGSSAYLFGKGAFSVAFVN